MSIYRGFSIVGSQGRFCALRRTTRTRYASGPHRTLEALRRSVDDHWLHLPVFDFDLV